MTNITKKDILSFGKVLTELGRLINEKPDLVLNVLSATNKDKSNVNIKSNEDSSISEKASSFNIFEDFKGKNKDEIFEVLSGFSKDDLNYFIRKFNLGYTRYKSTDMIADYIADKVSKRNTDVFINQK